MDPVVSTLLTNVTPGAIIVGLAYAYHRKDQELKAVRDAHDVAQKEAREWSLKMLDRIHEGLDKVATLVEAMQRRGPR